MLEIGLLKYIIQLIGFILTGENIYKIRNKFNSIFLENFGTDWDDTYCYAPLKYLYKLLNK